MMRWEDELDRRTKPLTREEWRGLALALALAVALALVATW